MNTRTTTIRIPVDTIAEIDVLCKKTGSCRNSWINAAIDFMFTTSSEYDFGLDDEPEEEPKITIEEVPDKTEPAKMVSWTLYDDDGNIVGRSK